MLPSWRVGFVSFVMLLFLIVCNARAGINVSSVLGVSMLIPWADVQVTVSLIVISATILQPVKSVSQGIILITKLGYAVKKYVRLIVPCARINHHAEFVILDYMKTMAHASHVFKIA